MSLLDADLLVVQQVRSFLRTDFAILDGAGTPVGRIRTRGSLLTRAFLGPRSFDVVDAGGDPVVGLDDIIGIGRDRFVVRDPAGGELGTLVKEFTLVRRRLTLHLRTGETLDVRGRLFDLDYEVTGPGGPVARVGRRWPGIAANLFDRDRYVVGFTAGVPPHLKAGTLATVVAIDVIRAKEEKAAASRA